MKRLILATALLSASLLVPMGAAAATPQELLSAYVQAAGARPDTAAGQAFFGAKHGRDWSCATCHTANPVSGGKHATTGKLISPLAPAGDSNRFAEAAKTEKWFRRNCNDVVGRECSAAEKANVLAWLVSLKS